MNGGQPALSTAEKYLMKKHGRLDPFSSNEEYAEFARFLERDNRQLFKILAFTYFISSDVWKRGKLF